VTLRALQITILLLLLLLFFIPRKNEGGKKLRKVERGLKWKTSPGGPQRVNRRAAIRHYYYYYYYTIHVCIHFCQVRGLANQTQVRYGPTAKLLPTDSSFRKSNKKTQHPQLNVEFFKISSKCTKLKNPSMEFNQKRS